jgi:glycosyltransferase involved in cell wall biosynthesis
MRLSVVIPTHNRPEKLAATVDYLQRQDFDPAMYEIVVVDDGSSPPVVLPPLNCGGGGGVNGPTAPRRRVVRLEGLERSAARNAGAAVAEGAVLVFIDDDMRIETDFLSAHLRAHDEWRGAIAVGAIRLPDEALTRPFGRFRQKLELQGAPSRRGLTSAPNFCAAANMSIPRDRFYRLGGFDQSIASSEDQDLALRHTSRGGVIAFLPDAMAIHLDDALDIRSYCRRTEWGIENMLPFCRRYPAWPENLQRKRANDGPGWGREPIRQSLRKTIKSAFTPWPMRELLFVSAFLLERLAPRARALDGIYRFLLGVFLVRGYRRGVSRFGAAPAVGAGMTGRRSARPLADLPDIRSRR